MTKMGTWLHRGGRQGTWRRPPGRQDPVVNFLRKKIYQQVLAPSPPTPGPLASSGATPGAWRPPPRRQVPHRLYKLTPALWSSFESKKSRKKERRGEAKRRSSAGFSRDLQV